MIILASGSPRRKEILNKHGIDPIIIKPEVDETIRPGFSHILTPVQTVMYYALKKGQSVINSLSANDTLNSKKENAHKNNIDDCINDDYLIAADTIVYDDRIIGKPNNQDQAFQILSSLRNKMHYVLTGVMITNLTNNQTQILCDTSKVFFRDYSDAEIKRYINDESPMDKAGAYAIQSSWGEQVLKIEGDLENIIGLPWYRIASIIE